MFPSEQSKDTTIIALISGSFLLQLIVLLAALLYRFSYKPSPLDEIAKNATANIEQMTGGLIGDGEIGLGHDQGQAEASDREIKYQIAPGDTLSKIWAKFTAFPSGGMKAAEALKAAKIQPNSLRVGDELQLKISGKDDILELHMKLPEGRSLSLIGNSIDGYKAEVTQQEIITRERTVSYSIDNSFSAAALEVNVPAEIVDDLVDLFSGRINFSRDIRPGDSFTVIYDERVTADGERLQPGAIKAISIENANKLMVAIRHAGKDGVSRYYNENGEQLGNGFLRYPVKFTRISSIFTKSRFHPVLKVSRPHNGVDFAAPTGTPVRTIGDGIVEYAGYSGASGNMVKVKHNDKYSTAYLHLSKISVKKGERLRRGEVIGAVGSTGHSTGPHLHFSLYENGKFINPMTSKLPTITNTEHVIPKTVLASTMGILRQQHELIRIAALIGLNKAA